MEGDRYFKFDLAQLASGFSKGELIFQVNGLLKRYFFVHKKLEFVGQFGISEASGCLLQIPGDPARSRR